MCFLTAPERGLGGLRGTGKQGGGGGSGLPGQLSRKERRVWGSQEGGNLTSQLYPPEIQVRVPPPALLCGKSCLNPLPPPLLI